MYAFICRYLFDMVISVHAYKQDKISRVIKSRRMKSEVHGTQTIHTHIHTYIYIYIYIYTHAYICACVCVKFVSKNVNPRE